MGVGEALKSGGWKQGVMVDRSILTDLSRRVAKPLEISACCGVVISHSCDLFNESLDEEPFVEILLGFESGVCSDGARRGNQTHGKNPRALCLEIYDAEDDAPTWAEFRPFWRLEIPRDDLVHYSPDHSRYLTDRGLRVLVQWLAHRYSRAAFPDEFNARLNKARNKLKSIHKRISPNVSALYARLHPEGEVEKDDRYSANFLVAVPEAHEADLEAVESEMQKLEELLEENRIDAKVRVRLETQIPLSTIRTLKRLPLDSLSLAATGGHPEPADV